MSEAKPIDPIKVAMIRTLMRQIPSQTGAGIVVASYMIGTAWAFSSTISVVAWGIAAFAYVAVRYGMSRAFLRRQPPDDEVARWAGWYTLCLLFAGLMYGAAFLLFAHPDQPITIALTLAALYSMAAGSTPSCAYHPPAILGAVIPTFAAVFGKLVLTGQFEFILLGVASALYGLTMIAYCKVQSRTLEDGFRIRFENEELLEQLRVEKAAAEQANLAKSQFLAAASHDLRQPLYALGLFSTSLEELTLDAKGRDVVRRIHDSIGAMESSFEGLLDLSKLEAGVVQPRLEPVDVDALFDRISQIFRPLAMTRGLDLRFRSDGQWVRSDVALLEQVIGNLTSNAIRATTSGGVLIAARRRGDLLRFEVHDTGRGIAPHNVKRIFEDYVQLDNPQRDRQRGLGLGLAIAQRSVELLGARIEVASRLGRGSCFGFAQPLASAHDAASGASVPAEFGVLRRGDDPLLIVEDDEDVRAALGDLLSRWGLAHESAIDAEDALESLRQARRFSLLITDQRLPGMTGLDLIRTMREEFADPPPALIVTGEVDSPLLREAHDAGIHVLHKPLRPAQLRQLLGAPAALVD